MSNEPDKVNSGVLATVITLLGFAMLGVALTVTALVRSEVGELAAERDNAAGNQFRSLRAEQQAALNAPAAWADRAKGLVSLPIDRAQKLVLEDIRSGRTWVGQLPAAEKAEEAGAGGAGPEGSEAEAAPAEAEPAKEEPVKDAPSAPKQDEKKAAPESESAPKTDAPEAPKPEAPKN